MSHLKTIVRELGSYQKESCVIFAEFLVIFYSDVPKISFSTSQNTANSSVTKGLNDTIFSYNSARIPIVLSFWDVGRCMYF